LNFAPVIEHHCGHAIRVEGGLAEVRQIIARHEAEFLAPLSKTERETLRELLAKLIS